MAAPMSSSLCSGHLVAGIASGAAMLPYTVIKEANPPEYSGTATGVINFLNFTFSALLGPVFGWLFQTMSGESANSARTLPGDVQVASLRRRAGNCSGLGPERDRPGSPRRCVTRNPGESMTPDNWNRQIRTAPRAMQATGANPERSRASVREIGTRWSDGGRTIGIDFADTRRACREDRGDRKIIGNRPRQDGSRRCPAQSWLGSESCGTGPARKSRTSDEGQSAHR